MNSNDRIQVSTTGQHLRIEDSRVSDSGTYTCRAENSLGTVEASAKLKVKARPRPLELTMIPHDTTAREGVTIQMPCR